MHHGCLLVRGLLPESQAMELIEDTDRSFQAREADAIPESLAESRPWFVPFDPDPGYPPLNDKLRQFHIDAGAVLAAESPRSLFHLIEAFERNGLIEAIRGYLGERPVISLNKCVLRHTGFLGQGSPTWHQDGAFLGPRYARSTHGSRSRIAEATPTHPGSRSCRDERTRFSKPARSFPQRSHASAGRRRGG